MKQKIIELMDNANDEYWKENPCEKCTNTTDEQNQMIKDINNKLAEDIIALFE